MRKVMRNSVHITEEIKEQRRAQLSERNEYGDRLFNEKWSKKKNLSEGLDKLYNENPNRARGLAIILENTENALKRLTETQISTTFAGITPQNVVRIVRLGYPNSVRGEIFEEIQMVTPRDSFFYISPVYTDTARGATAGDITYTKGGIWRYATEMEFANLGTGNDVLVDFTVTVPADQRPLRPGHVNLMLAGSRVAVDDANGNFIELFPGTLDPAGVNANTVNYTTGVVAVSFITAPVTGASVDVMFAMNTEVPANYTQIKQVELQLRDHQFRSYPHPLNISWSIMTEHYLGGTLDVDAEEALIRGASQELKKSLDVMAIKLAYGVALRNPVTTFDTDKTGYLSDAERAKTLRFKIDEAVDSMFDTDNRGGYTSIFGHHDAVNYFKFIAQPDDTQPKVGVHKVATYGNAGVYKGNNDVFTGDGLPTKVAGQGDLCLVYNNFDDADVAIAFGSYVPLYTTPTLEFKSFHKETGLAYFGDEKVLRPNYLRIVRLTNMNNI